MEAPLAYATIIVQALSILKIKFKSVFLDCQKGDNLNWVVAKLVRLMSVREQLQT